MRESSLARVRAKFLAITLVLGAAGVAAALTLRPSTPGPLVLDSASDAVPVHEAVVDRAPEALAGEGFIVADRARRRLERALEEWKDAQALVADGKAKDVAELAKRLAAAHPGFFDDAKRAAELARMNGVLHADDAKAKLAGLAKGLRLGTGDRARLDAQIADSLEVLARAGDGADADQLTRHLRRFLLPSAAPTGSDGKDWTDTTLRSFVEDRSKRHAKDPVTPVSDVEAAEQRRVDQLEKLRQRGAVGLLDAIHAGLAWLALHQRDDGSFCDAATAERCKALNHGPVCVDGVSGQGDAYAVANTALVLIAFLDFRDQDVRGWFDPYLAKGLEFLRKKQREDGGFGGAGQSYSTSMAVMALAQAAGSTGTEELRAAVRKGVGYLSQIVGPLGGWRYGKNDPGDLSATAWAAQAIEAARNAGIDVPFNLTVCLDTFMKYFWVKDHRFTYTSPGGEKASLFPAGMLVGHLAWKNPDPIVVDSWKAYLKGLPPDKRPDLYTLYYGVRVSILLTGDLGDPWKSWVFDLSKRQIREGSKAGSFPADLWRWPGGVTVQTAVAVLAMEHSLYLR